MLRGDLEGQDLDAYVEERVLTTTLEKAVDWARGNSLFPLTFGLACCAIEMMSIVGSRLDIARFGFEAFRASPRQADLLILSGRVSIKMAPVVRRIYDQMLEPKYVIAMGACSSSMGVFNNYAIVPARQVHAGRRPRPRLPAAARGADARHPPAAVDGPARPEPRLARALRRRGHRGGRPRATRESTGVNVFGGGGTEDSVPDATGLELLHGTEDRHEPGSSTPSSSAARRRSSSSPDVIVETLEALRERGYRFLASVHGADEYPDEPRLGRPLPAARHGGARPRRGEAARPDERSAGRRR